MPSKFNRALRVPSQPTGRQRFWLFTQASNQSYPATSQQGKTIGNVLPQSVPATWYLKILQMSASCFDQTAVTTTVPQYIRTFFRLIDSSQLQTLQEWDCGDIGVGNSWQFIQYTFQPIDLQEVTYYGSDYVEASDGPLFKIPNLNLYANIQIWNRDTVAHLYTMNFKALLEWGPILGFDNA